MSKSKQITITVQGRTIGILPRPEGDYISLTGMVRNFDGASALIEQWLKNKDTILFLGVWERINNPLFKYPEFEGIRNESGRNSFYLSAKKCGCSRCCDTGGQTFYCHDTAQENTLLSLPVLATAAAPSIKNPKLITP